MASRAWDEEKYKRDGDGKFSRKPGGGGNLSAISGALRDVARPADDVEDSPSRHSTGRGMPSILSGADITTRGGQEIALDRHADDSVTVTSGNAAVTFPPGNASNVHRALKEIALEDVDVGEERWVKSYELDPDGRPGRSFLAGLARKEGEGRYSLRLAEGNSASAEALRNTPPLTISDKDIDNIDAALYSMEAASRVDSGNGDVDLLITGDKKFALRHVGEDGEPAEVAFNAKSFARVSRAIDVVIDGFDGDDPAGPDGGVTQVDVNTNVGKVRIQLDGKYRGEGPGDRLTITPVSGDGWGITVNGPQQRAFMGAWSELSDAGEVGEFYDPNEYR